MIPNKSLLLAHCHVSRDKLQVGLMEPNKPCVCPAVPSERYSKYWSISLSTVINLQHYPSPGKRARLCGRISLRVWRSEQSVSTKVSHSSPSQHPDDRSSITPFSHASLLVCAGGSAQAASPTFFIPANMALLVHCCSSGKQISTLNLFPTSF